MFVGGFDLLHTITFDNMYVVNVSKYNLSIQYYLAARYIEAISFFIFSLLVYKTKSAIKLKQTITLYYVTGFIIFLLISFGGVFPAAYVPGVGFTRFETVNQIVICSILIVSIILLVKNKERRYEDISRFLISSISFEILSELCFILYINSNTSMNILAHIILKKIVIVLIVKTLLNILRA